MSMKVKHWQDPVNLIVGLWMLASPWVLGYQTQTRPMWNSVAVGILIALVALYALFQVFAWQERANAILGAWLIASPWLLGFSGLSSVMLNAVIAGVVVLVLAIWALGADKDLGGWWRPAH